MNVYVRRLADDLTEIGLRVDIFTRRTDRTTPEIVETDGGARVVHLAAGPPRHLPKRMLPLHIPAMVSAFRSFMQRESLEYDILHTHYWLSGLVALRLRAETAAPIVHMFHTLSGVKELYSGQVDPGDTALRFDGERCIMTGADAIVGATTAEREQMEQLYGRSPARFAVIPPGVDTALFRPFDADTSRRRLNLDGDRIILFVGRPDPMKRLDLLLHALAEIAPTTPGIKLVVVGGQDDASRGHGGRSRRLAERLGVADRVEFRGLAPQDELPLYYSAADLCAVPSSYESFGMVAVESMACQTPVVAFPAGGLATTVSDGQTGFLAEGPTTGDFVAALRRGLQCDKRESMGRRARLSIQGYNWLSAARTTADLYAEVLREQRCWCQRLSGVG